MKGDHTAAGNAKRPVNPTAVFAAGQLSVCPRLTRIARARMRAYLMRAKEKPRAWRGSGITLSRDGSVAAKALVFA